MPALSWPAEGTGRRLRVHAPACTTDCDRWAESRQVNSELRNAILFAPSPQPAPRFDAPALLRKRRQDRLGDRRPQFPYGP